MHTQHLLFIRRLYNAQVQFAVYSFVCFLFVKYRDLDVMISKYEFWSHRLFPKMKFVDIVEKLEKLGDKREVKVKHQQRKQQQHQQKDEKRFIRPILQFPLPKLCQSMKHTNIQKKRALYNIRLGSGDNQNDANMHIGDDENDPNVEDERMTARVMAMMEKVNATTGNDDADDDDDDDDELIRNTNFESAAFRSQSAGARQVHAAESQGDDNDDDALFNSLLLNNNNN